MAGIWVMRVCGVDVEAVDRVGVIVCIGGAVKPSNEHCRSYSTL